MENLLKIGDSISAKGCITQMKYLLSSGSLAEMEKLLGYRSGRFAKGMAVGFLTSLPNSYEFELAGYNQVAVDKINHKTFLKNLNVPLLKEQLIKNTFTTNGPDRLVKVFPAIRHSDDELYPPGNGIPQWILTVEKMFVIHKVVEKYPSGKYTL